MQDLLCYVGAALHDNVTSEILMSLPTHIKYPFLNNAKFQATGKKWEGFATSATVVTYLVNTWRDYWAGRKNPNWCVFIRLIYYFLLRLHSPNTHVYGRHKVKVSSNLNVLFVSVSVVTTRNKCGWPRATGLGSVHKEQACLPYIAM